MNIEIREAETNKLMDINSICSEITNNNPRESDYLINYLFNILANHFPFGVSVTGHEVAQTWITTTVDFWRWEDTNFQNYYNNIQPIVDWFHNHQIVLRLTD